MFVQRLSETGVPEWVLVGGGDGDDGDRRECDGSLTSTSGTDDGRASASAAALADALASSLYADMLHDRPRAHAYAAALAAVLAGRPRSAGPPVILDIGTGTGLLAVLAARAAGAGASIVAVDQFPPMAELARRTVALAGLSGVSIHACRSDELRVGRAAAAGGTEKTPSLPRRADVVVAEILDSVLVGEGALPTAVDVGARLLAPGGVAIPARGRVLAQPVTCPALRARWDASEWCGGAAGLGCDPAPRPLHLDALDARPAGPPAVVLHLDLTRPAEVRGRGRARLPLDARPPPPSVDALAVWWEVDLTPDGSVRLETTPAWAREGGVAPDPWTDHWRPAWVPSGVPAGPPPPASASLTVEATYAPADLSVRVLVEGCEAEPTSLAAAYAPSGGGLAASAGRANGLVAAVEAAAAPLSTAHALTLGDGPLPALVAGRFATTTAVVTSSAAAAAAVRAVVPPAVEVVSALPPPSSSPATLLVAEPHYRATDGRPPWEALLRFLRDRAALVAAGTLAADAAVCPAGARLVAVGAATPDLARTAGPVGTVAGVDMAPFDAARRQGGPRAGTWLAPCRAVDSQVGSYAEVTARAVVGGAGSWADLADFRVCGRLPAHLDGRAVLTVLATDGEAPAPPPTIDAVVFWVEYAAADGGGATWSSGPARALFLLAAPVAVPSPGGLAVSLDLDITAAADLGGRLAVRAEVGVGK